MNHSFFLRVFCFFQFSLTQSHFHTNPAQSAAALNHSTVQELAQNAIPAPQTAPIIPVIFAYFSPRIFSPNFLPITYQAVPDHIVIAEADAPSTQRAQAAPIHNFETLLSCSDSTHVIFQRS